MLTFKRWFFPATMAIAGTAAMLLAPAAQAVHTQYWKFKTEAAYAAGHFRNTLVNNYGELRLSRAVTPLFARTKFQFVNAIVSGPGGSLYVGTSPHGKIYRILNGKRTVFYAPPKGYGTVLSLANRGPAGLLAGLAGNHARLVALTMVAGKISAKTVFENKTVDYIWAIAPLADGSIVIATGPHGELWRIGAKGNERLLLKTGTHNITSMAVGPHGNLIIGTDQTGMVMRVNPQTGKSFVLMAAGRAEISSVAITSDGDIFAGTASPNLAKLDGGVFAPQGAANGRPAAVSSGAKPPMKIPAKGQPNAVKKPKNPGKLLAPMMKGRVAIAPMPAPAQPNPAASNVVYQISPSGKSHVLLRVPDMVLSMLYQHHTLVLGLGNHGRLLFYNPYRQSEALQSRVKQADINALAVDAKGNIYLGTANQGQVYKLSARTVASGQYESKVLDGKLASTWGAVPVVASLPPGATVTVQTRSGNVANVNHHAKFWSAWSASLPANSYRRITSPAARYLQFRLILKSNAAGKSPVVRSVTISHQEINVRPQIASIVAAPLPGKPHRLRLAWKASDANGDSLEFKLEYRQQGVPVWIQMVRKLTETHYIWNTRDLPDGRYRVKLIATDLPDNSPQTALAAARETRYFLVENTPPTLSRLKTTLLAGGRVKISGIAADTLSPIVSVSFRVDSGKNWREATASDSMFDSPLEAFSAQTEKLSAGAHRISLRATDAKGNRVYRSVLVQVH